VHAPFVSAVGPSAAAVLHLTQRHASPKRFENLDPRTLRDRSADCGLFWAGCRRRRPERLGRDERQAASVASEHRGPGPPGRCGPLRNLLDTPEPKLLYRDLPSCSRRTRRPTARASGSSRSCRTAAAKIMGSRRKPRPDAGTLAADPDGRRSGPWRQGGWYC